MPRSIRTAAAATAREGEDRVYADDAADGYDTLDWIAAQPWTQRRVGMSGSSAGATTTFAAASTRHPSLRAFFAQAGGSSIYDDVVYEGQSIEMERLWLWVARNIPGLSAVASRGGDAALRHRRRRTGCGRRARRPRAMPGSTRRAMPSRRLSGRTTGCACRWPATPDFATWQPFLDEIITPPGAGRVSRRA